MCIEKSKDRCLYIIRWFNSSQLCAKHRHGNDPPFFIFVASAISMFYSRNWWQIFSTPLRIHHWRWISLARVGCSWVERWIKSRRINSLSFLFSRCVLVHYLRKRFPFHPKRWNTTGGGWSCCEPLKRFFLFFFYRRERDERREQRLTLYTKSTAPCDSIRDMCVCVCVQHYIHSEKAMLKFSLDYFDPERA